MPSYTSIMEKGHYGNAGAPDHHHGSEDVTNSASSGFALDFAGMLDAADSVLHQQIYEYLQGPAPVQQQSDHQFLSTTASLDQGLGFPGHHDAQALYPTSFSPLSTFQASMPAEHTSFHVDAHRAFEYRRKDQSMKAHMGSSGLGMSMPPMYTDVFHPPAPQPSLVYNAGREFSSYEASSSPNVGHLKRPASDPDILRDSESRPRGRKAFKVENGQQEKSHRPTEQAEHIIRERQRRDDMTSKFLMLESLLPPGPKRDRSTVVEDSIQYVKSLHHRVKELHKKRSEMKSNAISSQTTTGKPKQKELLLNSDQKTPVLSTAAPAPPKTASLTESTALAKSSTGSIEKIEVHLDLPHQIVIEMTCRPHRRIQSQIMAALEGLRMDVSRCSISKLHNRLICVIVVKPREMTEPVITSDDVIGALKRAVVPD